MFFLLSSFLPLPVVRVVSMLTFFTTYYMFPFPQQTSELVSWVPASWDNQTSILEHSPIIRPAESYCGELMTIVTDPGNIRASLESLRPPTYPHGVVENPFPLDSHQEPPQPVPSTFLDDLLPGRAKRGHDIHSASGAVQSSKAQSPRDEKGTFCLWLTGDNSEYCYLQFYLNA